MTTKEPHYTKRVQGSRSILFYGLSDQPQLVKNYIRKDIRIKLLQWASKYHKQLCLERVHRMPYRVSFDSEATLTFFALTFNARKPCTWLRYRIAKTTQYQR